MLCVGSQTNQANVDVLNSKIDTVTAALQAQIQGMATCNAEGKFYAPGYSGVDSNGCWANSDIPSGTIATFAATACPSGWTEYTPARGRFLRGIDNGAGNDPDGTRSPGAAQADMVGPHQHYFYEYPAGWGFTFNNYGYGSSYGGMVS